LNKRTNKIVIGIGKWEAIILQANLTQKTHLTVQETQQKLKAFDIPDEATEFLVTQCDCHRATEKFNTFENVSNVLNFSNRLSFTGLF